MSEKTLWNHTAPRGPIPCVKIGERVLYDPADLAAWIEREKKKSQTADPANGKPAGRNSEKTFDPPREQR